uniref:hypothetical protein n=1 Tax=Polynucleobacter sp. TaxID=2029855 RepID=UPI0040482999
PKGNISVGGAVTATTALSAANVTTVAAGYVGTVGVLAQQTVSLYALNKGDSATIGGLILTAAEDLTANQVASIFAAKITNNSNNPNSTTEGTFNATTFVGGFNATSLNNVLTLEADSFGPKGNISVGGAVTATTALSAANVTTVVSGSNGTAGVYDKQSVNIDSLKAGDSTTINGLTLTTAEDLTADQVASIFADKINSSVNPALSTGSFSGISLTEDFTAISINNVLTLTNKTYGPKNAITASKTVGGVDNALVGITSINDLMTIISANQATLEAASNNLSIAANTSIQIADQSQKKINEIENVDFTALQAALQMLNTQQSLDFYIVSQLNNTASSLLSIFR